MEIKFLNIFDVLLSYFNPQRGLCESCIRALINAKYCECIESYVIDIIKNVIA